MVALGKGPLDKRVVGMRKGGRGWLWHRQAPGRAGHALDPHYHPPAPFVNNVKQIGPGSRSSSACGLASRPRHLDQTTGHVTEPSEAEVRARLAERGGNIVRTAHALGLSSRDVLYRLMRKRGIEVEFDYGGGAGVGAPRCRLLARQPCSPERVQVLSTDPSGSHRYRRWRPGATHTMCLRSGSGTCSSPRCQPCASGSRTRWSSGRIRA